MPNLKLTSDELEDQLKQIPAWQFGEGKISRRLEFPSFASAFAFMTELALISEKMDHHPSWHNVYKQVTIELWTHDVEGLSLRDIKWALKADKIFNRTVTV